MHKTAGWRSGKEEGRMDQTINRILALDADTEERLRASELICGEILAKAREQAAAIEQAQTHQTRTLISDFEEQKRTECEERLAKQQAESEAELSHISEYFEAKQEELLRTLLQETLRAAEE